MICGNCGTSQGPFDALLVGDRKTGVRIYTCHIPVGKAVTPEQQKAAAMECHKRKDKKIAEEAKGAEQP